MMLQIIRMFRRRMQCEIDGTGVKAEALLVYLARHQSRITIQRSHAYRQVEALAYQVDTPRSQIEIKLYLG